MDRIPDRTDAAGRSSKLQPLLMAWLAAFALTGGGCAGVPIATVGTVAGLAASTVDTGADLYKLGKLDAADLATFDEVIAATKSAATEMRFALKGVTATPVGFCRLVYADDQGGQLTVTIQRRTATLTRTRIDVGLFGSEPTARLFLARLRGYLAGAIEPAAPRGAETPARHPASVPTAPSRPRQ
jgi:hypothetical protein